MTDWADLCGGCEHDIHASGKCPNSLGFMAATRPCRCPWEMGSRVVGRSTPPIGPEHRRVRPMTDEARVLLAGDLIHFFLMPLGLLEYSEIEPDLIRITNANGSFCLTIKREPEALSKADALVRIVNDWYALHGSAPTTEAPIA